MMKRDVVKVLVDPRIVMIENQRPLLSRAFDVTLKYDIIVYDALYIALAENGGYSLITCDESHFKRSKH